MEQIIETLEKIGICPESIDEIKRMDAERAHECAALLIAQYDDRHEYLD